ncbi:MAG: cobalamin-independent methionine synthase II family protein, partial [Acidimicrobiales bacterium]|nr:cobalamin-independent methionine synthase II family protein [Acidimicrobiales bacterium]
MPDTMLSSLRAEPVGSLPRPGWLRQIQVRHDEGEVTDEVLEDANRHAVEAVVARQQALGLGVVTDGELARRGFQESFGGAVTGFDATPQRYGPGPQEAGDVREGRELPSRRAPSGMSGPGPAILHRRPVVERLRLSRNVILEEYRRAALFASAPVKVTLIGPDRISQRFAHEESRSIYRDLDEFVSDVVAIERQMVAEVVASGCRYVQLDEPGYTAYVDGPSLEAMRRRGEDPDENLARSIAADNALIDGFPGVTFSVHICRGGGGGRGGAWFHREGHYDAIAERLFDGLRADRFLLEYDSEAAGSFESLKHVPKGRVAVLGLVSNHGEVETPEYLKRRLDEASRFLSFDQLALCPRCGFAGSRDQESVWAKLSVLRATADELW